MLLLQMTISIKREEIRKLEDKARILEEALQNNELMLEDDANKFEESLNFNDQKAHNTIRLCELISSKK